MARSAQDQRRPLHIAEAIHRIFGSPEHFVTCLAVRNQRYGRAEVEVMTDEPPILDPAVIEQQLTGTRRAYFGSVGSFERAISTLRRDGVYVIEDVLEADLVAASAACVGAIVETY